MVFPNGIVCFLFEDLNFYFTEFKYLEKPNPYCWHIHHIIILASSAETIIMLLGILTCYMYWLVQRWATSTCLFGYHPKEYMVQLTVLKLAPNACAGGNANVLSLNWKVR